MGQSFFSSSVEIPGIMRPFVALTFVMGCAFGAPADVAVAGSLGYAGLGLAGVHGLGYAAAPAALGYAAAPAALGYAAAAPAVAAAAPIAYGAEHYSAGPVVAHAPVAYAAPAAPAPYTTATQGAGVTTVHQPAPVVTKQGHLGQTSYVSGYAAKIHKPATPHLPIAVPTVLKGTHTVNAPIVKTQTEIHNVQDPVFVERKVDAPYDAPFYTQKIVEVPTPVHVDAPYNVPYPVAVQGEPIIKKSVAPAVVTHSHHVNAAVAAPAVAGYAGYAGHLGYATAPVAAIH